MFRAPSMTTILVAAMLAGCSGGLQSGDLELQLTGADQIQLFALPAQPNTEPGDYGVVSAIVTINEIDAKVNGVWTPLVTTSQTIDLLKLDNKTVSSLGVVKLPMGHVSELRFKLDEIGPYVVLKSGDKKPLEVPVDGIVKIDGKLDLDACAAGIVILDFDPHIKVEDEPGRREYELTCRAHIKTEELKGGCGGSDGGTASPDMVGTPNPCNNVVCMMNQICVVQNGGPSCMDTCTSLVCTAPEVCVVENNTPTCVNPGH
jgi:hypothetical protein